ncbi:DUF11 domain-containing protein [Deinococcus koreensis]|uniref:DUF11 domain-containing protein n=1 Tax=Deinococcus koreensis TaxID=2054903 RepID=UPI001FAE9449|nr:DUF11 domain-containing protein [Deinococcus koreensis]
MSLRPLILNALRVVAASLLLPTVAAAVGTPAGTSIVNQASGAYTEPASGLSTQVSSNVAVTTVQAVCALSVSPDGTLAQPARSVALLPGEGAVLPYTLVNAGNAPHTFALGARLEPGSTASPGLKVVLDSDQDGQAGAGEPQLSSLTLAADASAALLLVADAVQASGDAYVNLVAACPGGQSAEPDTDQNNVSQLRYGPPPEFRLSKTFTPALIRPGSETGVTISASNTGAGASREVVLSDLLEAQTSAGLSFVPGSAVASAGSLEYTTDGAVWVAAEPSPVRGVRVRVDSLAPGAALRLSFRMLAVAAAENRVIGNTATLLSGGAGLSATASADVRYLPAVAIGPLGNPQAPEGSAEDTQTRPFAAVNQPVCFDHTVKNTGDVQDAFTLSVAAPQASSTLSGAGGAPLAQPLLLEPGQSAEVRVCYQAQAGALGALVTVTGARGTSNTTRDLVAQVAGGLPELTKSAVVSTTGLDGRPEPVPAGGTVAQGDTVEYTLSVRNPYPFPLTSVVLTDAVPAHLDVVSSAPGVRSGAAGQEQVVWTLGTLAPGETRAVKLLTRVSPRAVDGESLSNTFSFSSFEVAGPLLSNEVLTPIWSAKLVVSKAVGTREVTYGDRLTYTLRISNTSLTTDVLNAVVTDTPMPGLDYLGGTSTLDGQPLADPVLSPAAGSATQPAPTATGTAMRWNVPSLKAGTTITITYQLRVTPLASGELDNVVEVSGVGAGKVNRIVASNRASAKVRFNPLKFSPTSDIVGTVFVDRNRNGLYDEGLDTPLPRARVLLAGGRQAITDPRGRYSFLNVPQGTQALRLDPGTSPYEPLHVARDGGLSGTQTVFANGLTSVDFPLAPLGGDVTALRRTTLLLSVPGGEVRVDKSVYSVPGGYLVTLRITSPQALAGAELTDPLPEGALLKDGRNTWAGTFSPGEQTLTYRFTWDGEPRLATTDPLLTWRP